jgi:hypothetical protein
MLIKGFEDLGILEWLFHGIVEPRFWEKKIEW